jgi:hypothetical protein
MPQITLYTVITGKRSYIVTYAQSPAYETKVFSGAFNDPGEASQEFKKTIKGKLEFLKEGVFQRKVGALSYRYQQDLLKLQTWNQSTHTNKRKSPMSVSNEQYFNNLSASGLELAEEYLEEDLQTLQENDLPVSDTVVGLLTVHTLQEEEQEVE